MKLTFAVEGFQTSLFLAPQPFSLCHKDFCRSTLLRSYKSCSRCLSPLQRFLVVSRGRDLKLVCNSSFDHDQYGFFQESPSPLLESLAEKEIRMAAEEDCRIWSSSMSIEMKANSLEIPGSLRLIRQKRKHQCLLNAENFDECCVKIALSSLVFMVSELQTYALRIREGLYGEDLREVITTVQREMNSSFGWLFQHVFSRTPVLMVHVMIILANFTVTSMSSYVLLDVPEENSYEDLIEEDEEETLWNSIEKNDDYMKYFKTDLYYQMGVAEDPNNSLLLINYGKFLWTIAGDYERAEMCFKRAVEIEPVDAEALSRYADFLWRVSEDLLGAEEKYLEAIEVAGSNYYESKYKTFISKTGGGKETCFLYNSTPPNMTT